MRHLRFSRRTPASSRARLSHGLTPTACVFLSISLLLCVPSSSQAEDEFDWNARVRAYGSVGGNVALYRALGTNWELGLQTQIGLDSTDDERTGAYSADSERNSVDISLYPELRRQSQRGEPISTFWGGQGIYKHRHTQYITDREEQDYYAKEDLYSTTVGLAATFGATARVHPHIAISADLVPLSFAYTWSERKYRTEDEGEVSSDKRTGTDREFEVTVSPALYVVVYF